MPIFAVSPQKVLLLTT